MIARTLQIHCRVPQRGRASAFTESKRAAILRARGPARRQLWLGMGRACRGQRDRMRATGPCDRAAARMLGPLGAAGVLAGPGPPATPYWVLRSH